MGGFNHRNRVLSLSNLRTILWLLIIIHWFDFDSLRIHFLCFNCVHQNKTIAGFSLVAPFHFSLVFRQFKVLDSHRQSIFLFCLTSITLKIIIWVFWTVLIWGVSVNVITKLYICVLDSSWNLLNIEKLWQIHANLTKRQSHENGLGNGDLQVVEVWYFVGWRQNTKPVKNHAIYRFRSQDHSVSKVHFWSKNYKFYKSFEKWSILFLCQNWLF